MRASSRSSANRSAAAAAAAYIVPTHACRSDPASRASSGAAVCVACSDRSTAASMPSSGERAMASRHLIPRAVRMHSLSRLASSSVGAPRPSAVDCSASTAAAITSDAPASDDPHSRSASRSRSMCPRRSHLRAKSWTASRSARVIASRSKGASDDHAKRADAKKGCDDARGGGAFWGASGFGAAASSAPKRPQASTPPLPEGIAEAVPARPLSIVCTNFSPRPKLRRSGQVTLSSRELSGHSGVARSTRQCPPRSLAARVPSSLSPRARRRPERPSAPRQARSPRRHPIRSRRFANTEEDSQPPPRLLLRVYTRCARTSCARSGARRTFTPPRGPWVPPASCASSTPASSGSGSRTRGAT